MQPPKAKIHPTTLTLHGDSRTDNYFWLNDRENPETIAYLEAENAYAEAAMKDTEALQTELFEEMKARYKKDDNSLPYFFNGYWYYLGYEAEKEYAIFCRKKTSLDNPEEIMLDSNELAADHEYFDTGSLAVSMDNRFLCYSVDVVGRRIYTVHFKDLATGEVLEDQIENTTGKGVWSNDGKHIFYIKKDKTLRAHQVWRHELGTTVKVDVLIFHEEDDAFDVNVLKSKSLKYIFITSSSSLTDEWRFVPAQDIFAEWKLIQPRIDDLEYSVEHYRDEFYIITNDQDATNFKLVKTKVEQPGKENWTDIIPHRENVLLESFEIFNEYLVLEERSEGLLQIRTINNRTGESHYLPFTEPTYTAYIGHNLAFETHQLRIGYTSLTTPHTAFEYDMDTRSLSILREEEILGGSFRKDNYISERIWAPSRDGKTLIPISLVYHKNTRRSAETPLLLYGYGSYGHTVDASFSSVRLSVLDRGFVFAIAHIRGGEYLGRHWYEEGKMLQKKNTFYDFIDAAKFLIRENFTSEAHLYAMGGSAGGLLVGAVMNLEPQLFHGIVAQVPFVDVVTTMLDEEIPLTTGEYDEWGNPADAEFYRYMKSYSPYDNVEAKEYPHLLITTGLHDSQVQYWEPAKWAAKLRAMKTDEHLLILKTDMSAGHGGASGRFESLKEDALEYAFLLKLENQGQVDG